MGCVLADAKKPTELENVGTPSATPEDKNFSLAWRGDGSVKGKGLDAVRDSKQKYNTLVTLFGRGNLPCSLMFSDKNFVTEETDGVIAGGRSYDETTPGIAKARDRRLPQLLRHAHNISGRGAGSGALSRFPQNVGRSMVLFYSDPGNVVFDPFAGHNSRMELCVQEGRHYVGCDVSVEFMAFNRKRAEQLGEMYPNVNIELHCCDSRKVPTTKRSADFTITSPPYYDIEYYGDEPGQLGKAATYEEFLEGIRLVLRENFRVLKRGAYAVWFVNDFRRRGKFHLYHMDVVRLAESVGFITHDLLVVDLGRGMRECFPNQVVERRILPKRHEFGLVFRKPIRK